MAVASIMLASCGGHSPLDISKKEIIKQCNQNLVETGQDSSIVMVDVGYYELNDTLARLQLEKLQAAGIIDYSVERFAWWETNVGTWSTTYNYNEHFMVNVSLTKESQKYVLSQEPQPIEKVEEERDLIQPKYFDSLYPENKIIQLSEDWPEVPHPLAEETYQKIKAAEAEIIAYIATIEAKEYSYELDRQMYHLSSLLRSLWENNEWGYLTKIQYEDVINEYDEKIEKPYYTIIGDVGYSESNRVIEEATAMLTNAFICKEVDKASYKMRGLSAWDSWAQFMNDEQQAAIETAKQSFNELVETKKNELGCNPKEPEVEDEVEYVLPEKKKTLDPQAIAYKEAKDKETMTSTILFANIMKAVVARNIKLHQDGESVTATAEVIYEIDKVTEAARVFCRTLNKQRGKGEATFTYFVDKGWVLKGAIVPDITNYVKPITSTTKNYSGKIGKYQVFMTLNISSDGIVKGAYYYESSGPNNLLLLNGSKDGSELSLIELNNKGRQTGTFDGELSGNTIIGEFENYKGDSFDVYLQEDNSIQTINLSNLDF